MMYGDGSWMSKSPISGTTRSANKRTPKSPRPFSPLDTRKIANIVVAKNLNEASSQVQVQALEVGKPITT
jgi:hypothetical protein